MERQYLTLNQAKDATRASILELAARPIPGASTVAARVLSPRRDRCRASRQGSLLPAPQSADQPSPEEAPRAALRGDRAARREISAHPGSPWAGSFSGADVTMPARLLRSP